MFHSLYSWSEACNVTKYAYAFKLNLRASEDRRDRKERKEDKNRDNYRGVSECVIPRLKECCKQVEADVVSNNKAIIKFFKSGNDSLATPVDLDVLFTHTVPAKVPVG